MTHWKRSCEKPGNITSEILRRIPDREGLSEFIKDGETANWSGSQWEYILDTLAEELSENVYPMMMYAANDQGDTHIMTLLRSMGCPLFDDNGRFCVNSEEGISALEWTTRVRKRAGSHPTQRVCTYSII